MIQTSWSIDTTKFHRGLRPRVNLQIEYLWLKLNLIQLFLQKVASETYRGHGHLDLLRRPTSSTMPRRVVASPLAICVSVLSPFTLRSTAARGSGCWVMDPHGPTLLVDG